MDNKIFNINGNDDDLLLAVLKLTFRDDHKLQHKAVAWKIDREKGLILFDSHYGQDNWHAGLTLFPVPLDAEGVFPIVKEYLEHDRAWQETQFDGWDRDYDHDGHNSKGWRVYIEDWGRIGEYRGSFIAIRPAYMWHGK